MAQQHATGKSAVWPSLSESRFARRVDLSDGLVKLAMRMHSIYIEIHMIHIIYIYIQTGLLEIVLRHAACLFFYVFCVLSPCYFSDMLRDNSALLPRVCDILYMEHGGSSIQTFPIFPRVRRAS